MKVSVVVPVYNPGTSIRRCINSLLKQTMPPDDFEVIFVDDGSTDDAPEMLDRVCAKHSHFRVVHQENSGWPGKPRNVGVAAARGGYVQFLDQDDRLGPDALRRLHEMASCNNSDIVAGKVVSDFRNVPQIVFSAGNVDRCTIRDFPLVESLTPHKMFRRGFLADRGIAYPEGRRRLEDQLFVMRAYLAADVVSVVADYPCYYYLRRDDGRNAGNELIDPQGYYDNLREVLDVVVAATEPGALRNSLLARSLRSEILGRLGEPAVIEWPDDYRRQLFAVTRDLVLERFDDAVVRSLPVVTRIRAVLLRDGRLDALVELARRCAELRTVAEVIDARWVDGALHMDVRAHLAFADDEPLRLIGREGSFQLDPRLVAGVVDADTASVGGELTAARVDVSVRQRRSRVQWPVPTDLRLAPEPLDGDFRLATAGTVLLDPAAVAGGSALDRGTWEPAVNLHALGVPRKSRLRVPAGVSPEPAIVGTVPVVVVPTLRSEQRLSLDVGEHRRSLAAESAERGGLTVSVTKGARLALLLPVTATKGRPMRARVTLIPAGAPDGPACTLPARVRRRGGRAVVYAPMQVGTGPEATLRPGAYDVWLQTGNRATAPVQVGRATLPERPAEAEGVVRVIRRALGRLRR